MSNWLSRINGSRGDQGDHKKVIQSHFGMDGAWINRQPPGIQRDQQRDRQILAPTFHGVPQVQHSTT